MKKILLASTALVLSAGLAHAQAVRITGEGRMGIMYTNAGGGVWAQENRLQFNFNVAVEADHGLTFGAWTRARITNGGTIVSPGVPAVFDAGADGIAGTGDDVLIAPAIAEVRGGFFSGSRVWVEANGFRLTFGNVDGAFRGAGVSHGYLGGCGVGYEGGQQCGDAAGLLAVTQGQASTGGGPAARVRIDYTMGDTRVALSHDRGASTEIGIRTRFDAFTVAVGYTNNTAGIPVWALSGHYNGGAWGVGALIASDNTVTNYSLSGNVALGGGNLYGYVGRVNGSNAVGLNYGYGLGGGATLSVGAERVGALTTASVGVAFNF